MKQMKQMKQMKHVKQNMALTLQGVGGGGKQTYVEGNKKSLTYCGSSSSSCCSSSSSSSNY